MTMTTTTPTTTTMTTTTDDDVDDADRDVDDDDDTTSRHAASASRRSASTPRRGPAGRPARQRGLTVGVHRRGIRLPAVAARRALGDRQRRRTTRRRTRRVRVRRPVHLGRRRRSSRLHTPASSAISAQAGPRSRWWSTTWCRCSRSSPGRCGCTGTPNRRSSGWAWWVRASTAGSPRGVVELESGR